MSRHSIPDAALDDRLGFTGTAGSGKTYNAGGAVERVLARKGRVIWPDPLGVAWGLRLMADGKTPSPFDVVIFGGHHGDLVLTEHSGALIGETVAGMVESCILDLSELGTKAAERRFMLAFLTALYRHASGEPVHVIFDEADMWAPQRLMDRDGDAARLLGMMETIVRRGRVKGFIPWLVTQRPAVLSKDVLSQVDGLISFKLTSSQDRDALEGWVEGQADKQQWKDMRANLPTLQRGQGIIWVPARGVLETTSFPKKMTFDSSRTPKRGEKKRAAALKPIDLGTLKDRLATVEAETKANDPRALKAQIADLQKQLRERPDDTKSVTVKGGAAIAAAEERGFERGKRAIASEADKRILDARLTDLGGLLDLTAPLVDFLNGELKRAKVDKTKISAAVSFTPTVVNPPSAHPIAAVVKPRATAPANGNGAINRSEQKIIDAIRWWNALGIPAPSHAQAAFVAGYSHKSGTWATYLSRLRSAGMIEGRGDLVLTSEGREHASEPSAPPTGDHLRSIVLAKIDGPLQRILTPILEVYPNGLSHVEAAGAANYSPSSGTWATYLSRLRSLDLIEDRTPLKAQTWMFP